MNTVLNRTAGAVDRDNCIVYGVKVLGFNSQNGRIYEQQAVQKAVTLYENAPVNKDHKIDAPSFSDRLGWLQNVRMKPDGLYADFKYNPHADGIESFLWFAENNGLGDVGFSHLVSGKYTIDPDGTERVVRIDRVRSVDLVANPATTTTIFESKEIAMKDDKMMQEENPVKEMYKEEAPSAAPTEEPSAPKASEEPASDMLKQIMDICVGPGEGAEKGKMILELIAAATGLGVSSEPTAETTDVTGNPTSGVSAQAKVDADDSEEPEEDMTEAVDELIQLRKWKEERLKEDKILGIIKESKLEATPVFVKQLASIDESLWAEAIDDRKKVALARSSVKPVSSTAIQGESSYQQFRENVLGK